MSRQYLNKKFVVIKRNTDLGHFLKQLYFIVITYKNMGLPHDKIKT